GYNNKIENMAAFVSTKPMASTRQRRFEKPADSISRVVAPNNYSRKPNFNQHNKKGYNNHNNNRSAPTQEDNDFWDEQLIEGLVKCLSSSQVEFKPLAPQTGEQVAVDSMGMTID